MTDHAYSDSFVAGLQWMWGEGFLSPGGAAEVAQILDGISLGGCHVLDIGCGLGGIDALLVEDHGAAKVTAIDIDVDLVDRASAFIASKGLSERIECHTVTPGTLPYPDNTFDIVFSKDSLVHVPDKAACYSDIHRILKPGGQLAMGDWFGSNQTVTPEMQHWLTIVGLDFKLGTLDAAGEILASIGFRDIVTRDRNRWYADYMKEELASLSGERYQSLQSRLGHEAARQRRESSLAKQVVVNQGQLRPGHIQATAGMTE